MCTYIVNVAFTVFIVNQLSFRLFLVGFRIVEEVRIRIAVVIDFCLNRIAIQKREVAISAGGEALNPTVTKLLNLLVQRIVSHNGNSSHGADWPEEEPE